MNFGLVDNVGALNGLSNWMQGHVAGGRLFRDIDFKAASHQVNFGLVDNVGALNGLSNWMQRHVAGGRLFRDIDFKAAFHQINFGLVDNVGALNGLSNWMQGHVAGGRLFRDIDIKTAFHQINFGQVKILSRGLALIFVGLSGVFWASSGVAVQDFFVHSSKTAIELTNIRMCTAGAILILLAARRKTFWLSLGLLNRHPKLWLDVIIYGIVGVVFMQFTYFQGISIGGAAATTVICYACPAMVVLWESIYHQKLPKRGEVLAVVLAMCGVFLLVTGGNPTKLLVPLGCVLWSLASGAAFAFSAIYPKHLFAKKIDPYFLTGVGMFVGGLFTFALIDDRNWLPFLARDVLFDVGWIIIFGTVCAFLAFNAGLKFLTPEEASITATTEPAASVVISWLVFGTAFGLVESVGIILVLLAIVAPSVIKR